MELSSFLLPAALLLISYFIISYFKHQPKEQTICRSTTLKSYPIIGTLPHLLKNGGRFLDWATELVVASPTHTATVAPIIFTGNPANVEHMLKAKFDNYPKGKSFTTVLHDFLGDGIFNTDGDQWKEQRKTASYEFNTKSLRAFIVDLVRSKLVKGLIPLLDKASIDGAVVDVQHVLDRFAFDGVCTLLFSEDPMSLAGDSEGMRFFHAFEEATSLSVDRFKHPLPFWWKILKRFDIGVEKRLRKSTKVVHKHVGDLVLARKISLRQSGGDGHDILARFIREGDHSEEYLRDIMVSLIVAGRDTTPSTMTSLFWVLSRRPDVVHKILVEIKSIRAARAQHGNDGTMFSLEELKEMQYLHAVLSETLRLYPPVALQNRTCQEDDVMPDGTAVRKGWTVMYNSYAMGRLKSIWGEDCMDFMPERWLDDEGVYKPKNPFQYPVFHAGPRMCLGKDMAYLQMKATTACILERFEMELAEERGQHQLVMTLIMKGGLPMRFMPRKAVTIPTN